MFIQLQLPRQLPMRLQELLRVQQRLDHELHHSSTGNQRNPHYSKYHTGIFLLYHYATRFEHLFNVHD